MAAPIGFIFSTLLKYNCAAAAAVISPRNTLCLRMDAANTAFSIATAAAFNLATATKRNDHRYCNFTAVQYPTSATVTVRMAVLYLMQKSTMDDSTRSRMVVLLRIWRMMGCNFSPSSTAISLTRLRALSSPACTVVFCTVYSLVTEVPSLNALAASSCSHLIISRLPANADMTWAARAPFSPMSLNTGASTSMFPRECSCSSSISRPSLVSRVTVSLNFFAFRPVAFTIWSCCLNISMMTFDTAVEDISTF